MRRHVARSFLTNQFRACGSLPVSFGSGVRYKGQRRRGVRVNAGEFPAKTFCREADGQSQGNSETLTQANEGKPRDSGLSSPWPCRRGVAPADRPSRGDLQHVVEPEPSRAAAGQRRRLARRTGAFGHVLGASQKSTKKVLFFTKSSGFPHSVVTRKGDRLALAERTLIRASRQGTRLRGRRLQGRTPLRTRQDRRVGRLRLLHNGQPEQAWHRRDAAPILRR